jgi:arsenite methyltransferase
LFGRMSKQREKSSVLMRRGIPDKHLGDDQEKKQTSECFSYKWGRKETYDSDAMKQKAYRWLIERYFGDEEERNKFVAKSKGKRILDAGCGSGFSASVLFGKDLNNMEYLGVDLSESLKTAQERFQELGLQGNFMRESIATMKLGKKFDIIFCEGVLHHTSNPFQSLRNLVFHLDTNGIIMFYVYRKKAVIRELVDDLIRGKLKDLSNENAWKTLMPLTRLGKMMGDLNMEIALDEDIPLLDIPKGTYDLQRFLYWFFIKMYYDKDLSLEEMNHVNFDWYRPLICHRFQPEEVETWLYELKLQKMRFVVEESGITAVAKF